MKTPQNAPFCIKSTKKILGGGGGEGVANPTRPPPFPGLVACTAKKASYAPDIYDCLNTNTLNKGKRDE